MNSEEFGETFLRSDREGPTKARMAGKKEAKQKAGPSGQKEKYRKETEDPTGVKDTLEDAGRRPAQDTQRKEAHKDLKDQGEFKKPSMTKRRQARKVATMVSNSRRTQRMGSRNPRQRGRLFLRLGMAGTHSSKPQ